MRFEVHRNHLESQAPPQSSVRLRLPSMGRTDEVDWVEAIAPAFHGAPFEWKIGVRPLDLEKWLIIDDALDADRDEKAKLIDARHHEVVVVTPGAEVASAELLDLVVEHLAARNVATLGGDASAHPIEQAARLVQEDLVVLERSAVAWHLTAACVCFPTRWDLASKRGLSMADIHGPVPRYATDLEARTDTFFDRLRVERPVWRTNWTIDADHGNRLEPDVAGVPTEPITAENVADALCLRVEYQTLRRLPKSDAIVFTIRILRRPLRWALDHGEGERLAAALDAMPDDVAGYKAGSVRYRAAIDDWLAREGVS